MDAAHANGSVQRVVDRFLTLHAEGAAPSITDFVARHTGLGPDLRTRLEEALLIQRALVGTGAAARKAGSGADEIPGYRLGDEIHRGGQGVVYRAVQLSTQRDVAIKVLHRGDLARESERARLAREAQVLGALRHANVVTVHDFGVVGDSCYLVMDYIVGQSVDAYLEEHPQTIRQTLALLLSICEGVNAAHLGGVIHRDLKPSNIRVDPDGRPHVLDFGLAKWTDSSPDWQMTQTGQFVGSLPWASPEQVAGDAQELDTRTDVYSLGVLAYQMLTACFPYAVEGKLQEIIARILSEAPRSPRDLRDGIDEEVETILFRCLAKERERRYQTAGELARDIRRYLNGEPIEAKRDSSTYLLRKVLWRYRLPVGMTIGAILTLGTATVALLFLYQAQHREYRRAEAALVREALERERAETRTTELQAVAQFQARMLHEIDPAEMGVQLIERLRRQLRGEQPPTAEADALWQHVDAQLSAVHPADIARDLVVEHVLDRASGALQSQFAAQPLIRGELHAALGGAYDALGATPQAIAHLRAALQQQQAMDAPDREALVGAQRALGLVLSQAGAFHQAEELLRAVVAHVTTNDTVDRVTRSHARLDLAAVLQAQSKLDEVDALLGAARDDVVIRFGTRHPALADVQHAQADLAQFRGDFATAETFYRAALRIRRSVPSPDREAIARTLNDLAGVRWDQEDLRGAETLFREALQCYTDLLGVDHPEVAAVQVSLAVIRRDQHDYDEAEQLQRAALKTLRRWRGGRHPEVATALNNLGELLVAVDKVEEGEGLLHESLSVREHLFGSQHPGVATVLSNLGMAAVLRDDLAAGENHLKRALEIDRALHGGPHPDVIQGLNNIASLQLRRGAPVRAEATLVEALGIARELEDRSQVALCLANLGEVLVRSDACDRAVPVLRDARLAYHAIDRQHPRLGRVALRLGGCLAKSGQFSEAEAVLDEGQGLVRAGLASDLLRETLREAHVELYRAWHGADPSGGYDAKADAWADG